MLITEPDLLILDDIEPHEARYSAALAANRLATLREAILPLNIYAHVILVGTVTMQGSIVHQIVRYSRGEVDEVVFIEVKTGDSRQSAVERSLRKAIERGSVRYVEYRAPDGRK